MVFTHRERETDKDKKKLEQSDTKKNNSIKTRSQISERWTRFFSNAFNYMI